MHHSRHAPDISIDFREHSGEVNIQQPHLGLQSGGLLYHESSSQSGVRVTKAAQPTHLRVDQPVCEPVMALTTHHLQQKLHVLRHQRNLAPLADQVRVVWRWLLEQRV